MSRLSATLDGKPVYLYEFIRGSYEDRRDLLYAHAEDLSRAEIIARVRAASATLPEEIEYPDYSKPLESDLFQQALAIAGFVYVGNEVPLGMWLRGLGTAATERRWFERSIDRFEEESKP